MKTVHYLGRGLAAGFAFAGAILACVGVMGCFKTPDPLRLKCNTGAGCPADYYCDTVEHVCRRGTGAGGNFAAGGESGPDAPVGGGSGIDGSVDGAGGIGGGIDATRDVRSDGPADVAMDAAIDVPVIPECPTGQHSCGGKCVFNNDPSSCGSAMPC